MIEIQHYLLLSFILFSIGITGVLIRRNAIIIFMCIELILNSVNLLMVAFSNLHAIQGSPIAVSNATHGQVFVFFNMVVAATEVTVGLAIIVMIYRQLKSVDIDILNRLKN